ncbi:MAG: hypothetical protein K2M91_11690, partial [Lachnospiraceae bacterium]|nr:hypothetical protein [Lachnospiraceae bacterium]
MNTESASFIFEPQTEETLSTIQSSTQDSLNTNIADTLEDNNEDIEDTETTVPPRKNIALESASFIVTDNRGDTELLGYNDCETFLTDFGFDNTEPFYQYFDEENNALQLTLYYNEKTGMGGGIRYDTDSKQTAKTGRTSEGFIFNSSSKFQYSDTFLASLQEKDDNGENIDCYDIYTKGLQSPDYFLYIDHTSDCLCVDLLSLHDVTADAQGKQYGIVGPSLSRNKFTETVLTKADYEEESLVTHTYAADYDGDGKEEAFVIAGEWGDDLSRKPTLNSILGELWFVDSNCNASRLIYTTT